MPKIKSEKYLEFRKEKLIDIIRKEQLKKALGNIKGRHTIDGRALLIALYYTGARPNEILRIFGKDIVKQGTYITVRVPSSKGGTGRKLWYSYTNLLIRELWNYSQRMPPEAYLFWYWKNKYTRKYTKKDGTVIYYTETTDKLRYHFKKWFKDIADIPPYYLRHNRFSQLAEKGASFTEIKNYKGALSISSVMPYIHMSAREGKKMARLVE